MATDAEPDPRRPVAARRVTRQVARHMADVVNEPERRSWLSNTLIGLAVASAGLGVVATASLAEPSTASGTSVRVVDGQPVTSTGFADAAFDPQRQPVRTDADPGGSAATAAARAQGLQRSYQMASTASAGLVYVQTQQQALREQQLGQLHQDAGSTAAQLAQQQQDARIARQVAAEMAARADAFRVEAEAAAMAASAASTAQTSTADATGSWVPADATQLPPIGRVVPPITTATYGAGFGDTSGLWARYHTGLDFHAGLGEPIHAVADGVVTLAGRNQDSWAGLHVAVEHAGGYTTMYSHMSAIQVRVGQRVHAGDVIGLVGATGHVTGPHLHFEVYPPGVRPGDVYRAIDPLPWLRQYGVQLRHT